MENNYMISDHACKTHKMGVGMVHVAQLTPEFCEQQDCHWSPTFPVDLPPTEIDSGPMLPYQKQGIHSTMEICRKSYKIKKLI